MTNEERKNQEARDAAEECYADIGVPTIQDKFEKSVNATLKARGLIRDEDGIPKLTELDHEADLAYKRGYQAALNDMKKQLEALQQKRRAP